MKNYEQDLRYDVLNVLQIVSMFVAVLGTISDIMKLCFPISGRFGGDEFVVIIPDTDFPEAEMQAEKLKKEFEEYVQTQNYTQLSLSIGIFSSKEHNAQEIIRKADEFMYNIKHASR